MKKICKASHARAKQGKILLVVIDHGEVEMHGRVQRTITDLVADLNTTGVDPESEDFLRLACYAAVAVDSYGDYGRSNTSPTIPDYAKTLEFPIYWSVV
jgi:hypothetical protein